EIERAAAARVHHTRVMAEHAHLDSPARASVERKLIMAGVAARGSNHVVNLTYRCAVRNEVIRHARVIRPKVVNREVARAINTDGVSGGGGASRRRSCLLSRFSAA